MVRRHVVQLLLLIALAAVTFLGTRVLAQRLDALRRADAEIWFARGEAALVRSDVKAATVDFRQADLKRPGHKVYVLRYVEALRRDGQAGRARRALIALRESAPDDTDVNLALARLAAAEADYDDAIRYYRNALYAPWPEAPARRRARIEFIRFLLRKGDDKLARAELLAVTNDLPATAAAHVEVGDLLAAAGDPSVAREQYANALRLEPGNAAALLGAGRAAFELRDFAAVRRFLRGRDVDAADSRKLQIAESVLTMDPLAGRLSRRERSRRARRLLDAVTRRVNTCRSTAGASSAIATLLDELTAASSTTADESSDVVLRLTARAAATAARVCGALPLDDAVMAMSELHESDGP